MGLIELVCQSSYLIIFWNPIIWSPGSFTRELCLLPNETGSNKPSPKYSHGQGFLHLQSCVKASSTTPEASIFLLLGQDLNWHSSFEPFLSSLNKGENYERIKWCGRKGLKRQHQPPSLSSAKSTVHAHQHDTPNHTFVCMEWLQTRGKVTLLAGQGASPWFYPPTH